MQICYGQPVLYNEETYSSPENEFFCYRLDYRDWGYVTMDMPAWLLKLQELEKGIVEKLNTSPEQLRMIQNSLKEAMGVVECTATTKNRR